MNLVVTVLSQPAASYRDYYLAGLCELDGIAEQIDQNLAQTGNVPR